MTAYKLDKFGGMLPAWGDQLVPDGQATFAQNGYFFSGELVGWRLPKALFTLQGPSNATAFRIPTTTDDTITAASTFVEFADPYTDVLKSPVVDDTFQRYYFASPSQQPSYNTLARIEASQSAFLLGVPAPADPPGVVATGGTQTVAAGYPTSVTGNTNTPGANQIALIPITPSGAVQLLDVEFVPTTTNAAAKFAAVVYSDNSGLPLGLIAQGSTITGSLGGATLKLPFLPDTSGNFPQLQPDTQYWIGVMMDSAIAMQKADDTGLNGIIYPATFSSGAPAALAPSSMTGGQPDWWMWGDLQGLSVFEARSYVYTYVTQYGEEGPPSEPTIVNAWSNGTFTLTLTPPQASDMGASRNIVATNIYRTVSDSTGATTYFFVDQVNASTTSYVDTISDSLVALNNQLLSTNWDGPPTDLQGFVSMPNGMIAGFRSNEIWFCEPYRPHAWNPNYTLTTPYPIVGLGVVGQSVVAATESAPFMATGVNPANMAVTTVEIPEPCLSRGSIVGTDAGVFYMSLNGLILVAPTGIGSNVTEAWVTRDKWRALTPSKNIKAIKLASCYFAYGFVYNGDSSVAQQGFIIELSAADSQSFSIWPQPGGHRLGFIPMTAPNSVDITNLSVDKWTGIGLIIQNGVVNYWDFSDSSPALMPYKWRSKVYQSTAKQNFQVMRVFFTVPPGTPAQSAARNTAEPQASLSAGQYGIVRVYAKVQDSDAGMTLYCTREFRSSGELLRIYSGLKSEMWQWEVESIVQVKNIQTATSVKELARV